jgi:hypothetical protein
MFAVKAMLLLAIPAFLGAVISKKVHSGILPWWCGVISSAISGFAWGWMASRKEVSLIYASTLYDVIMAVFYVLAFLILGDTLSLVQVCGIILAVAGIVLINQ